GEGGAGVGGAWAAPLGSGYVKLGHKVSCAVNGWLVDMRGSWFTLPLSNALPLPQPSPNRPLVAHGHEQSVSCARCRHVKQSGRPKVFKAFADPTHLARWWGPSGFRNTFEEFDFRPGGTWRFTMHGPDGTDHPNRSVFLDIQEPARI